MERTSDLDQNLINFKQKLGKTMALRVHCIPSLPVCERHASHCSAVVSFLNPSLRHRLVVWVPRQWQAAFLFSWLWSIHLASPGTSSRPDTVGTTARYVSTAPAVTAELYGHSLAGGTTPPALRGCEWYKENLESMTGGVLHLQTPYFLWPHRLLPALELFITPNFIVWKKKYIKLPIWMVP